MPELCGAILVGGLSTRMGRDKSSITLPNGHRMLDIIADALMETCGDVVLIGGCADGDAGRFPRIADLRDHAGPLGGIEAVLASGRANEYVVCPCDLPHVTPNVLRGLLVEGDRPATVFRVRGRRNVEPLPARIAAAALSVVQRMLDDDERSVWKLMDALCADIVELDAQQAMALRNVNTPEDLSMA